MSKVQKVQWQEYLEWYTEYFSDRDDQRPGQHFLNTRFPEMNDPELFNCEDEERCQDLILAKYVELI